MRAATALVIEAKLKPSEGLPCRHTSCPSMLLSDLEGSVKQKGSSSGAVPASGVKSHVRETGGESETSPV